MDDPSAELPAPPAGALYGRPRRSRGGLDPISAGLRALWASMEEEAVPDEFRTLLDAIEAAHREAVPESHGS